MSNITIYDLKYTLASGKGKILAIPARHAVHDFYCDQRSRWRAPLKEGRDCAMNRDAALELADELRQRKIRSLQRKIERLQALEFTIEEEGQ